MELRELTEEDALTAELATGLGDRTGNEAAAWLEDQRLHALLQAQGPSTPALKKIRGPEL